MSRFNWESTTTLSLQEMSFWSSSNLTKKSHRSLFSLDHFFHDEWGSSLLFCVNWRKYSIHFPKLALHLWVHWIHLHHSRYHQDRYIHPFPNSLFIFQCVSNALGDTGIVCWVQKQTHAFLAKQVFCNPDLLFLEFPTLLLLPWFYITIFRMVFHIEHQVKFDSREAFSSSDGDQSMD